MKRIFLLAGVVFLTCSIGSCDKSNIGDGQSRTLQFSLETENQVVSKATLIGSSQASSIAAIGVCGKLGSNTITSETATLTDGSWKTTTKYCFKTGDEVSLFAFYPTTLGATVTSDVLGFSYTVPTTAATQEDVMVGHASTATPGAEISVSMPLKHALTSLAFVYGDVPSTGLSVTGITVSGVYSSAKCSMSNAGVISWSNHSAKTASFTGSTSVEPLKDADLGESATFTLIPQDFDATTATITVEYTLNGESGLTATFSPTISATSKWEAGKTYKFVLNCDQLRLTVTAERFNGGSWYTHGSDNTGASEFDGENW